MKTTRPSLGKFVCGMAASLIIFLAGGWLILAPFALGYQPYGADWASQTTNSFVMGICIAVVALLAFGLFFYSLIGSPKSGLEAPVFRHGEEKPPSKLMTSIVNSSILVL